MRKLTVHRKKQFVASAMKVRICINTPVEGDIKLSNANLKVIGELRNGKSLDIEIPEENVDVYVVFDKFFPQKFHAKYTLQSGVENETLYVFSRYNPFKGNPFMIAPSTTLTTEDKKRIKQDESTDKGSTSFKILYWIIMIVAGIAGAILGWSIL